uniref:PDZ domain-containing protein n=1 Tax=Periophthalmus magnuspinnatus TaxID=409849 RepID=A0A3B4ALW7_9GOBI
MTQVPGLSSSIALLLLITYLCIIHLLSDSRSPCPRLCVLKREQGESYGFYLRVERGQTGHIIRNIASGGIAERSGLMDGDKLLEVNCCFVDDVEHQECATVFLTSMPFSRILLDNFSPGIVNLY